MKRSEILKNTIDLADNTNLEKLWATATGNVWEENGSDYSEELGLFWMDKPKFVIVPYVTKLTGSGWKKTFEEQNAAIFIGWVGETELINSSVRDLLEEKIREFEQNENDDAEHEARYNNQS